MRSKVHLTLSLSPYNFICILYVFPKKGATPVFSVFKLIKPFYVTTSICQTPDFWNYFLGPVGVRKMGFVQHMRNLEERGSGSNKNRTTFSFPFHSQLIKNGD